MNNTSPELSIVIPIYNEAGTIESLANELNTALADLRFELIFVDDGSKDESSNLLKQLADKSQHVTVIQLANNFGQSTALAAGFREASAPLIATIDGDGQNDPRDLPKLIAKLGDKYDVVSGWRQARTGSLVTRRIPSLIANWLIDRVMGGQVHDNGCGLKLYRKPIIDRIKLHGEGHRLILVQAALMGARIGEVAVSDRIRTYGKSNYGISRIYKVLLDLLALKFLSAYGYKPIRIFGGIGSLMLLSSVGLAIGLLVWRFSGGGYIVQTPLAPLAGFLFISGLLLVLLGLLAELIVRVYQEVLDRPDYIIQRRIPPRKDINK